MRGTGKPCYSLAVREGLKCQDCIWLKISIAKGVAEEKGEYLWRGGDKTVHRSDSNGGKKKGKAVHRESGKNYLKWVVVDRRLSLLISKQSPGEDPRQAGGGAEGQQGSTLEQGKGKNLSVLCAGRKSKEAGKGGERFADRTKGITASLMTKGIMSRKAFVGPMR